MFKSLIMAAALTLITPVGVQAEDSEEKKKEKKAKPTEEQKKTRKALIDCLNRSPLIGTCDSRLRSAMKVHG